MKKNIWGCILFLCLGILVLPGSVFAHRVILFAWVEGDMVHVEGGFGSDKPAKNCDITAYDRNQTVVFKGKTDKDGRFSFKVPEGHTSDMVLELAAGPGHKGAWTIGAEEFASAQPPAESNHSPQHKALEKGVDPVRILAGIGVIFGLALGVGVLRKKAKGPSHD